MDREQEKTEQAAPGRLTRRQVLQGAAGTGVALLLPMIAGSVRAAEAPPQWKAVGKAEMFKLNQPQRVALPDGSVLYVTRTAPAKWTAVSAKCTHRGCEVGWDGPNKQLLCPCHGAAFGADGHNLHGTRRNPGETLPALASLPVRQHTGQIEVNMASVPAGAAVPAQG